MVQEDILDDFGWKPKPYFEECSAEVVAKFYSPLEAEVAAARLRAEGIPCFLVGRTAQSVLPHLQLLVRLHVRPQDVERARHVLAEAVFEAEDPQASNIDKWALVVLFALLGLLLAILLVQLVSL